MWIIRSRTSTSKSPPSSLSNQNHNADESHSFEIDLSWHKGLKNTGKNAEVYAPQSGPNGLIQVTVARSQKTSKL